MARKSQARKRSAKRAAAGPVLTGDGTWPFQGMIDGDDIVVNDIIVTCFGGWGGGNIADPQDDGETASGVNTKWKAVIGVSVPMDGRQFSTLKPEEHRALDGAPIPRLLNRKGLTAWHTLVVVTIDGLSYTPPDGIIDLGPGLQASKPGQPHALDLTPLAAQHFQGGTSLRDLARNFEKTGSYRVIGGATLIRM